MLPSTNQRWCREPRRFGSLAVAGAGRESLASSSDPPGSGSHSASLDPLNDVCSDLSSNAMAVVHLVETG